MADFSWSDSLRAALSPCLTCLQPSHDEDSEDGHNRNRDPDFVPRARLDELEGLLADTDDAETLSLQSNIGQGGKRKKRGRPGKSIKLFGFYPFGRPPIRLPDDEADEAAVRPRARTISRSTIDSDAAVLDSSTIAQLSASRMAESAAAEEAERSAREERRIRKEERKLQKAALAAALERGESEQFEGFQGSGDLVSPITSGPGTYSSGGRSSGAGDGYGAFQRALPSPSYPQEAVDEDDADFDGFVYSKSTRVGGGSSNGSDSRSRTSGSVSNADPAHYNHHYISHPQDSHSQPPSARFNDSTKKQKKKSKSSKHSSSTSRSDSISTPPPSSFPLPGPLAIKTQTASRA
ncbi:hypothetical protein BC835DRAFT_797978 [Cytidiella melzeri]|nr:hypothetical protein BC835DRAFT_797978 [Cytidiella melzeri]